MTGAEMEHAIEFLLGHDARVSAEIQQLREAQERQGANLEKLSLTVAAMAVEMQGGFKILSDNIAAVSAETRGGFAEMREGFNNLIVANEVTRDLAQKAAQLAIATSQRVTRLEQNPSES